MAARPTGRRRGFTLIELVIVICIIGLLTAVATRRLLVLRIEAERAALSQVVGGLQNAVSLEALSLITRGRDAEIAGLVGTNPMELLLQTPWTYLGAFDDPDAATMEAGRWYFDRGEGLLVYRVRYGSHFETDLAGPPRIRFRVRLVWNDENRNDRYDPSLDRIAGARLEPVETWQWRIDATRKS